MAYQWHAFSLDLTAALRSIDERVVVDGVVSVEAWLGLLKETAAHIEPDAASYLFWTCVCLDDEIESAGSGVDDDGPDFLYWLRCCLAPWARPAPSLPGPAVGIGIVEAFLWEHDWSAQDTAVLLRGQPIETVIRAEVSAPLASAGLDDRWVDNGLIPVEFCHVNVDRLRALESTGSKTVSWETWSTVPGRPGDDGTDTWFRTYSGGFPELLDAAMVAARGAAEQAIDSGHPLFLAYGW